MDVDVVDQINRETYATFKPGVGWLEPESGTGIFDPITDGQMIARVLLTFKTKRDGEADVMAMWSSNPAKMKAVEREIWALTATPEELLTYALWSKYNALCDTQYVESALRALSGLAHVGEHLDANPMMLGTPDGVMDLRDGEMLDPIVAIGELVTKRTAVVPAPVGSRNPSFEAAIESAIPAAHREYLRWHLARGLVAEMAQKALIHVGSGANGKSMILGLAHRALGDYSVQVDSAALTGNTPDYHKALLRGARMAYLEELETGESNIINPAVFKMLVATPTITARPIREAPITFPATWSVHICTNSPPRLDTGDGGVARRPVLIKWPHKYVRDVREAHERAINITDVAAWGADPANQASMLRWLIDVVNLPEPALPGTLAEDLADYKAENDLVESFVNERCEVEPLSAVTLKSFGEAYAEWCAENRFGVQNRTNRHRTIRAWVENKRGVNIHKKEIGLLITGVRVVRSEWFSIANPAPVAPVPPAIVHLDELWPDVESGS